MRVGPTFYQTHAPSQVSNDQHSTLIAVTMPGDEIDKADKKIAPIVDVVEATNGRGGYQVLATGQATLGRDFTKLSESDLQKGEAIGIPIALLILLAVFGTVVAALIPVVLAIFAIVVAIALAALIGQISPLSFFVVNMITFMGLAVGIDYSLFIVSRYREERRGGHDKLGAIEVAGSTANRAVLFSGMTVVLALVGMLIVPTKIFVSLGAGAILVVLVAVISALTLLPAVLSLLGDRVESLRVPFFGRRAQETTAPHEGFWGRTVDLVMRHRVIAVVASVALLLICAIPYLNINTGAAGPLHPAGQHARQAGLRRTQPRLHRWRGHPRHHRRRRRSGDSRRRPGVPRAPAPNSPQDDRFGPVAPAVAPPKNLAVITVPVAGDPNSDAALNAVRDLRGRYLPDALAGSELQAYVTGASAQNLDYFDITDKYLPIVFALVLGLSFILLTLAFRSIVVPASSIVMNLLSVGAAYGLLVLVTQEGHGAGLFGFQVVPTVEAWIPLFLFSVLFGLSMDYQVFLLSRIRERYDQRGDSREAVAYGITSTARLITGAALIMVAVFAGFAAGQLVMFQQMGFGLGVAILIDATLVRTVLMPAWMEMLGDRNWYMPKFLDWLPDFRVEPPSAPAPRTGRPGITGGHR